MVLPAARPAPATRPFCSPALAVVTTNESFLGCFGGFLCLCSGFSKNALCVRGLCLYLVEHQAPSCCVGLRVPCGLPCCSRRDGQLRARLAKRAVLHEEGVGIPPVQYVGRRHTTKRSHFLRAVVGVASGEDGVCCKQDGLQSAQHIASPTWCSSARRGAWQTRTLNGSAAC